MSLRAPGPLGLIRFEQSIEPAVRVRVYPRPESVRALPRPAATHVGAGNYVTRTRGEGLEFADLRPHVPGDRLRQVNWRVSARRGRLHVNEYHPERNADVVLFLDSFTDTRDEAGGTIDMTVRAAAALAAAYLRTRDRVGIVGFGGVLRWVLPSTGQTQAYRILDSLIDTQVVASYAWREVAVIPARTLPPHALVVALSPLADARMLAALADLRARGIDLAVIDVSPLAVRRPARRRAGRPGLPAVAAPARAARVALPDDGRAGGRVDARAAGGRGAGPAAGGAAIRPNRAHLALLLAAWLVSAAVAAHTVTATSRPRARGRGRRAAVAAQRGPRRRDPRPLGGRRRVGDRARRGRLRRRARARRRRARRVGAARRRRPGRGSAELGEWAIELHRPAPVDAGIMRARAATILALAAAGAGAGWLVLLASNAGSGGLALTAAGLVATAAAMLLVSRLARAT